jgi:hypothetical protein
MKRKSVAVLVPSFSKKAFVFSLLSILFLIVIFLLFQNLMIQSQTSKTDLVYHARFSQQFESHFLPRVSRIVVEHGIDSMIEHVFYTGVPLDELDDDFRKLFFTGIAPNGTQITNITFTNLTLSYAHLINSTTPYNLDLNVTEFLYSIDQSDPWYVDVDVLFVYTLYQNDRVLWRNETYLAKVRVPIDGLIDPVYAFHGYSRNVTFVRAPYEFNLDPSSQSDEQISANFINFTYHLGNETYAVYPKAPSFLSRFTNDTDNEDGHLGIENFVNPEVQGDITAVSIPFVTHLFTGMPYACDDPDYDGDTLYVFTDFTQDDHPYRGFHLDIHRITYYTGMTTLGDAVRLHLACPSQ